MATASMPAGGGRETASQARGQAGSAAGPGPRLAMIIPNECPFPSVAAFPFQSWRAPRPERC